MRNFSHVHVLDKEPPPHLKKWRENMKHISPLTIETTKELAAFEAPLCLTLTMPCIKSGDQQQQNPIRFKNLLQEAREKLKKIGCGQEDMKAFLSPLEKLLNEKDLWKHQDHGLLVCVTEDRHELYSFPFTVDVNVIVDRHFYLRPVIPFMQDNATSAILLLSMNDPTLIFAMGPNGDYEVEIPPEPMKSFDAFMEVYDLEESLQFRAQSYGKGSKNATREGYHGQGAAGDDATHKTHLKEYFKQLESWVTGRLQRKGCEEILMVAEPHLEGLYKNVMRGSHPDLYMLAQKNPTSEKPEVWVERMKTHQKDGFDQECERKLADYKRLKETDGKSVAETIPDILKAAYAQRVDALMIPDNSQDYYWGRFDPETRTVKEQQRDESVSGAGDELVNLAVIQTFLNGGKVFPIPSSHTAPEIGSSPEYAALCRW